jgi:hypothetical protein
VVALQPEEVLSEAEALIARAHEDRKAFAGIAPEVEEAFVGTEALRLRPRAGSRAAAARDRPRARAQRGDRLPAGPPLHGRRGGALGRPAGLAGRTVVFLGNSGRAERLGERLREDGHSLGEGGRVRAARGRAVFRLRAPESALRVLSDGDVYPEEVHVHRKRRGARGFLSDLRDLRVGDLIVHQDHGIGRFEGLQTLEIAGATREFMVLSYLGGDKLKVPIEAFDQIQRYSAAEAARPALGQARQRTVGQGQAARQEGDARHGRRAAASVRRAQSAPGPCLLE